MYEETTGPSADNGVARTAFNGGGGVSVREKRIIPVQFNKAACIITEQLLAGGKLNSSEPRRERGEGGRRR